MSSQKWFWSRVSNYTMGENCIQCLSLNGKQVGLLHAPHVAFVFAPCVARPDSPCLKPAQDTSFCHLSVFQQRQEEEDSLSSPEITCDTKDDLQKLEAWIQERKQLRSQLKSFGDVEKWLSHKPTFTKLEERVRKRITAARVDQRARSKSVETDRPDVSIPGVVPLLGLLYFISCGRATIKDSPIEWKEKCRLVRSGDAPVDEHCLPSTIEGDMGALVDHYRRNAVVNYLNCSKQCKERNICLTDKALQRGLLHPGDKIIKEGEDVRKIRQPGGYYSTGHADATSPLSMSRSKSASGKQAKEAENRLVQRGLMISPFLDNNFWPGHLLDKMRLYFPDKEPDRAHALFSYVHPTRPAYRGI
uniref:Uncharacterized protein n=1 Tax=Anas platyrhynchos TaxID=8839 RepID=A0A8B9T1Q6_ANAPL